MTSGHRRDKRFGWIIISLTILVAAMTLYACGKKADPLPPDIPKPEAISGLTIQKTAEGILLQWPPTKEISKIKIFRSEMAKEDCPGCPGPRDYHPLAELMRSGMGSATEAVPSQYKDRDVRTGLFYSYRIVACGQDGVCSNEGNIAEIDY